MESGSKFSNIFPRKTAPHAGEQKAVWLRDKAARVFILFTLASWMLLIEHAYAQDIEPRRWTPLPAGTNGVGVGYGRTVGDVFLDPLLQIENGEVDVDTLAVSYVRSF